MKVQPPVFNMHPDFVMVRRWAWKLPEYALALLAWPFAGLMFCIAMIAIVPGFISDALSKASFWCNQRRQRISRKQK